MNRIDRARQRVTYLGEPVQFVEIPRIGKIWPRATDTPTAWATVMRGRVQVDLPLNDLVIEVAR